MNWANAQAYCQAEYADLAIINSNDNVDRLQKQIQKWNFGSMAWIGLYNDVKSWRWSLDNTSLGNVTLWYTKTPNNAGGNRQCAVVGPWGWYDWQCTDLRGIMCYDGKEQQLFSQ